MKEELVATARVAHRNDDGPLGSRDADVGHDALVEDSVDDAAIVGAPLREPVDRGPLGLFELFSHSGSIAPAMAS